MSALPSSAAAPLAVSPLQVGDRIKSLHAERLGAVVKVYADGSACVCWDDGTPQAEGLGHERMPCDLLLVLPAVVHTPFQLGALAFRQALLDLGALYRGQIKTNGGLYPVGFTDAVKNRFRSVSGTEQEAGFWEAFAVHLGFLLEGTHVDPDKWSVLEDIQEPGAGCAQTEPEEVAA